MKATKTTPETKRQAKPAHASKAKAAPAGGEASDGAKTAQRPPRRQRRTIAEMRAMVLCECEKELCELASEGDRKARTEGKEGVAPDTFLRGLRSIAADFVVDRQRLQAIQRGYGLLTTIRNARDEAQRLLSERGDYQQAPFQQLARLVTLLKDRNELFFSYPEEAADFTRRELVLRAFDTQDFLGLRRLGSIRELALLTLYCDPDHGVDEGRGSKQTWFELRKAEMNAIRLARKRLRKLDPLYGR